MSGALRTVRRRANGVVFLVVLAMLLLLAVLVYNKAFTHTIGVKLVAGRAGHQLDLPADVKLRGIIVGQATRASSNGTEADIHLALDPTYVKQIPSNVSAEIIPKTLFGEKYVNLVIPSDPATTHFGDPGVVNVITQTTTAIEAEQVFNDLVPLLNTLQPVQLNLTLSNLADALQGRGNELGDNLARTDTYFAQLNPDIGNIKTDLGGLEQLATNVDAATPDLLAQARQFSVNARTLVAKGDVFANFLIGTRGFADVATNILTQNENNLVQLAQVSVPVLSLLATYSPEYPCLLEGLAEQEPLLDQTFTPRPGKGQKPELHLYLSLLGSQPPGYTYPADKPDLTLKNDPQSYTGGPSIPGGKPCFGLPGIPTQPTPGTLPINSGHTASALYGAPSPADALARVLAAPELGVQASQVPDLVAVLTAPQLAGMQVSVR